MKAEAARSFQAQGPQGAQCHFYCTLLVKTSHRPAKIKGEESPPLDGRNSKECCSTQQPEGSVNIRNWLHLLHSLKFFYSSPQMGHTLLTGPTCSSLLLPTTTHTFSLSPLNGVNAYSSSPQTLLPRGQMRFPGKCSYSTLYLS